MLCGRAWIFVLMFAITWQACNTDKKKVYSSECAGGVKFKKVNFHNLLDSLKYYDKQYIEVSGRYMEGKHLSSLVNDSTFSNHSNSHAFWINFTQDCPLYLSGKHTGLFETEDGKYRQINNKEMTLRGRLDIHKKGYQKIYSATINEISYLELY